MPLPNLEDLCLRKPFRIDRTLTFTDVSPDGRFQIAHEHTGSNYEVRLNGTQIGTTPGNYYVVGGLWSTDSQLYSCLTIKTTEEIWCTFTFSAIEKRRICHHRLGRIYATLNACNLRTRLLRMTPEGVVHGFEGSRPAYFTFHALKPSPVTHTLIPFFKYNYPESIVESPDGKTFAAYCESALLLSQNGYHWHPIAQYVTKEFKPHLLGFSNDGKNLTMQVRGKNSMETWTLPLNRLVTKPSPLVPPHAKRPIFL